MYLVFWIQLIYKMIIYKELVKVKVNYHYKMMMINFVNFLILYVNQLIQEYRNLYLNQLKLNLIMYQIVQVHYLIDLKLLILIKRKMKNYLDLRDIKLNYNYVQL